MKKILLATAFMALLSGTAEAGSKFLGFWPYSHWINQDFKPYYEDGTNPHNSQWERGQLDPQNWTPQQWIDADGGDGKELVRKWYAADIFRDQDADDGVTRITVGPNFYHLGGLDKRRVVKTFDAVYNATGTSSKTILLKDWRTEKVVGQYTQGILDIQ